MLPNSSNAPHQPATIANIQGLQFPERSLPFGPRVPFSQPPPIETLNSASILQYPIRHQSSPDLFSGNPLSFPPQFVQNGGNQYSHLQMNQIPSYDTRGSQSSSHGFQPMRSDSMPILASQFSHPSSLPQHGGHHPHSLLAYPASGTTGNFHQFTMSNDQDLHPAGQSVRMPASHHRIGSSRGTGHDLPIHGNAQQYISSLPGMPAIPANAVLLSHKHPQSHTAQLPSTVMSMGPTLSSGNQLIIHQHMSSTLSMAPSVIDSRTHFQRPSTDPFSSAVSLPKTATSANLIMPSMSSSPGSQPPLPMAFNTINALSLSAKQSPSRLTEHSRLKSEKLSALGQQQVRRRISRACDQCNQLRTKCDGRLPCAHCVEHNLGCEYARQRKKRGKVSKKTVASKLGAAGAATSNSSSESSIPNRMGTQYEQYANIDISASSPAVSESSSAPSANVMSPTQLAPSQSNSMTGVTTRSGAKLRQPVSVPTLYSQRLPRASLREAESTDYSKLTASQSFSESTQTVNSPGYTKSTIQRSPAADDYDPFPGTNHFNDQGDRRMADTNEIGFEFDDYIRELDGLDQADMHSAYGKHLERSPSPLSRFHPGVSPSAAMIASSAKSECSSPETPSMSMDLNQPLETIYSDPVFNKTAVDYVCLSPILAIIPPGRLSRDLARGLLDAYFISSNFYGSGLKPFTTPFSICKLIRRASILSSSSHPRPCSPALVASMLWIGALSCTNREQCALMSEKQIIPFLQSLTLELLRHHASSISRIEDQSRSVIETMNTALPTLPVFPLPENGSSLVVQIQNLGDTSDMLDVDIVITYIHIATAISTVQRRAGLWWWNSAFFLARELQISSSIEANYRVNSGSLQFLERREECRRMCWLLYMVDRHLGMSCNKQLFFRTGEFNALPIPINESDWEVGKIENDSPNLLSTVKPNEFNMTSLLIPFMGILDGIMGFRALILRSKATNQDDSETVLGPWKASLQAQVGCEFSKFSSTRHSTTPSLLTGYANFLREILLLLLTMGNWDPLNVCSSENLKLSIVPNALATVRTLSSLLDIDPDLSTAPYWIGAYILILAFSIFASIEIFSGSGVRSLNTQMSGKIQLTYSDSVCLADLIVACHTVIRALRTSTVTTTVDIEFLHNFENVIGVLSHQLNRMQLYAENQNLHCNPQSQNGDPFMVLPSLFSRCRCATEFYTSQSLPILPPRPEFELSKVQAAKRQGILEQYRWTSTSSGIAH